MQNQKGEVTLTLSVLGVIISVVGIALGTIAVQQNQTTSTEADFFSYKSTLEIRDEQGNVVDWQTGLNWDNGLGGPNSTGKIKSQGSSKAQLIYDATRSPGVPESLQNQNVNITLSLPTGWSVIEGFCENNAGTACPSDKTNSLTWNGIKIQRDARVTYGWRVRTTEASEENSCQVDGDDCRVRFVRIDEDSLDRDSVIVEWEHAPNCPGFSRSEDKYWVDIVRNGNQIVCAMTATGGDTEEQCDLGSPDDREAGSGRRIDGGLREWRDGERYDIYVYAHDTSASCTSSPQVGSGSFVYEKPTSSEPEVPGPGTPIPSEPGNNGGFVCAQRGFCLYRDPRDGNVGNTEEPICREGRCKEGDTRCMNEVNYNCEFAGNACGVQARQYGCWSGDPLEPAQPRNPGQPGNPTPGEPEPTNPPEPTEPPAPDEGEISVLLKTVFDAQCDGVDINDQRMQAGYFYRGGTDIGLTYEILRDTSSVFTRSTFARDDNPFAPVYTKLPKIDGVYTPIIKSIHQPFRTCNPRDLIRGNVDRQTVEIPVTADLSVISPTPEPTPSPTAEPVVKKTFNFEIPYDNYGSCRADLYYILTKSDDSSVVRSGKLIKGSMRDNTFTTEIDIPNGTYNVSLRTSNQSNGIIVVPDRPNYVTVTDRITEYTINYGEGVRLENDRRVYNHVCFVNGHAVVNFDNKTDQNVAIDMSIETTTPSTYRKFDTFSARRNTTTTTQRIFSHTEKYHFYMDNRYYFGLDLSVGTECGHKDNSCALKPRANVTYYNMTIKKNNGLLFSSVQGSNDVTVQGGKLTVCSDTGNCQEYDYSDSLSIDDIHSDFDAFDNTFTYSCSLNLSNGQTVSCGEKTAKIGNTVYLALNNEGNQYQATFETESERADFDRDGVVTGLDLAYLLSEYQTINADIDGDGKTNAIDYSIIITWLGQLDNQATNELILLNGDTVPEGISENESTIGGSPSNEGLTPEEALLQSLQ